MKITLMPATKVSLFLDIVDAENKYKTYPKGDILALVEDPNAESDHILQELIDELGSQRLLSSYIMPYLIDVASGKMKVDKAPGVHIGGFTYHDGLSERVNRELANHPSVHVVRSVADNDTNKMTCINIINKLIAGLQNNISLPHDIIYVQDLVQDAQDEINRILKKSEDSNIKLIENKLFEFLCLLKVLKVENRFLNQFLDDLKNVVSKFSDQEKLKTQSTISEQTIELVRQREKLLNSGGNKNSNEDSERSVNTFTK